MESEVIEKDIIKELMLHPVIGPVLVTGTVDSQDFIQCWKGFFETENDSVLSAD